MIVLINKYKSEHHSLKPQLPKRYVYNKKAPLQINGERPSQKPILSKIE